LGLKQPGGFQLGGFGRNFTVLQLLFFIPPFLLELFIKSFKSASMASQRLGRANIQLYNYAVLADSGIEGKGAIIEPKTAYAVDVVET